MLSQKDLPTPRLPKQSPGSLGPLNPPIWDSPRSLTAVDSSSSHWAMASPQSLYIYAYVSTLYTGTPSLQMMCMNAIMGLPYSYIYVKDVYVRHPPSTGYIVSSDTISSFETLLPPLVSIDPCGNSLDSEMECLP